MLAFMISFFLCQKYSLTLYMVNFFEEVANYAFLVTIGKCFLMGLKSRQKNPGITLHEVCLCASIYNILQQSHLCKNIWILEKKALLIL